MRLILLTGVLALAVACGPSEKAVEKPAEKAAEKPAEAASTAPAAADTAASAQPGACADGSAKLSVTGLCQSEAKALIALNPEIRTPELPEGCTWTVNETGLPGDEALLYSAASCKGVVTQLGFAAGARNADIAYERSAVFGDSAKGRVVVKLFGTDPDPQGALKAAIQMAPKAEQKSCEIQNIKREGWPPDALFIAPNAAARAKLPKDEPVTACGPMGIDETAVAYWRVRQGFAWYVDLGQEDPDVDAGNMTVVAKGADGVWKAKP